MFPVRGINSWHCVSVERKGVSPYDYHLRHVYRDGKLPPNFPLDQLQYFEKPDENGNVTQGPILGTRDQVLQQTLLPVLHNMLENRNKTDKWRPMKRMRLSQQDGQQILVISEPTTAASRGVTLTSSQAQHYSVTADPVIMAHEEIFVLHPSVSEKLDEFRVWLSNNYKTRNGRGI